MAVSCRSVLPRSLGAEERDTAALLGSCGFAAKGSGGLSSALGARERREETATATTSSPLVQSHANQDKLVDIADKYVAIVANKGFAVYVLSLKEQDGDNARILSRHEFSQVKTVRFARTKQSGAHVGGNAAASLSPSTDTGLSLVVIQDDGEIAVWKLFSLERGHGHRTEKWQMVNRIPPAQQQSRLLALALVSSEERLTILCLKRPARQQAVFDLPKVQVERTDLVMKRIEEGVGSGGDLSPRHRRRAKTEILGEILGADGLLCASSSAPQPVPEHAAHFWLLCSKRSVAFLWHLDSKRCVRKVQLPKGPTHLCVHNPSGDLMWITPGGRLHIIHKCLIISGEEGRDAGGGGGETRALSGLYPGIPNDQQIEKVLPIGPFLWIVTSPVVQKLHQKQSVTVFAYHASSGICVGSQVLRPEVGSDRGAAPDPTSYTSLLIQTNSISAFLVSAGGNVGLWKCQLKVPAAMDNVLSSLLHRLSDSQNTGGSGSGSIETGKPSVSDDLGLLGRILRHELSQWGNALQQQRVDATLAQAELVAKLGSVQDVLRFADKTSAVPALLLKSRTREAELADVFERLLADSDGANGGGGGDDSLIPSHLPDPKRGIGENTRKILRTFLDQMESSEWDAKQEAGSDASVYAANMAGRSDGVTREGLRVRICCLYFFHQFLATLIKHSAGADACKEIRLMHKAVAAFAKHLTAANALASLKERVGEATNIHAFAEELATWHAKVNEEGEFPAAASAPGGERTKEEDLYLVIGFEISCLMLYLVLPHLLMDFVLAYGRRLAVEMSGGASSAEAEKHAVREHAFRAACVLPAPHIGCASDRQQKEMRVQTQAKLYCMAGHPLCALHILKSTGHALNPQAAGLLLKTLSLTRSDDDTSVDLVIESIIQESIHSLFKQS